MICLSLDMLGFLFEVFWVKVETEGAILTTSDLDVEGRTAPLATTRHQRPNSDRPRGVRVQ